MTGKELLKTIKRERLKIERIKKEHKEEEKYFQVLRGLNYDHAPVSGGRVSTLDDVLERQEAEREKYANRLAHAYSPYIDHLCDAWTVALEMAFHGNLDATIGMRFFREGETFKQAASRTGYSLSGMKMLVYRFMDQFEVAYQSHCDGDGVFHDIKPNTGS